MKVFTPELHYHGGALRSQPVFGVDIQPHTGPITAANPLRVLTCGRNICAWQLVPGFANSSGEPKVDFRAEFGFERHESTIYSVRFSPSGQMLAAGSADGYVTFWKRLTESKGWKKDVTIDMEYVTIYENWTCVGLQAFRKHTQDVMDLAWSPDGRFVLTASLDLSNYVYDVEKQTHIKVTEDVSEAAKKLLQEVQGYYKSPLPLLLGGRGGVRLRATTEVFNISPESYVIGCCMDVGYIGFFPLNRALVTLDTFTDGLFCAGRKIYASLTQRTSLRKSVRLCFQLDELEAFPCVKRNKLLKVTATHRGAPYQQRNAG